MCLNPACCLQGFTSSPNIQYGNSIAHHSSVEEPNKFKAGGLVGATNAFGSMQ